MGYERDNIRRLSPYVPGEQPRSAQPIKLNTNENPYPPPDSVMSAIRNVTGEALRRYPAPRADRFRTVAAEAHGVGVEQMIATNGGDELLRLAITVFADPCAGEGGIGLTEPTYSLYEVLGQIHGASITSVPRGPGLALPEGLAAAWNEAGCRVGFVVNPHAPSGRLESGEALRALASEFEGVLVVDEAYVDFASEDALPLVRDANALDNVLLLRSLSKGYSLAGLRFGYGIGQPDLIAALNKARDSYNLDAVAQAAATAALESRATARESREAVIAERRRLAAGLEALGFAVFPSETNFLLTVPPGDAGAAALHERLKERNIFIRYFDQPGLTDKLRITVGRREENDALLAALEALCHTEAAEQEPT
jgi:histidinol-phosphate aminotransferase